MTRPTLAEAQEFVKILYYGDPGSGKTTATASLAKVGPIVQVAADPGLKARPLLELGVPIGNIGVERNITYDGLDKLFWDLKGEIEDAKEGAPIGVVWDSASEAHKKLLEQTSMKQYEKGLKKAESTGASYDRGRHDTYLEDYGTNTGEMRYFFRRFLDLECHCAFTALPRKDQDKETAEVSYGPDLTPALAMTLLGAVDIVCRTTIKPSPDENDEPEYWGQFRQRGAWYAKDRFHALPPMLINPTLDRVVAYVNGDLDSESDPEMIAARERRQTSAPPTPPAPPLPDAGTTGSEKKDAKLERTSKSTTGGFKRVAK